LFSPSDERLDDLQRGPRLALGTFASEVRGQFPGRSKHFLIAHRLLVGSAGTGFLSLTHRSTVICSTIEAIIGASQSGGLNEEMARLACADTSARVVDRTFGPDDEYPDGAGEVAGMAAVIRR
jgi:hypothetical protein